MPPASTALAPQLRHLTPQPIDKAAYKLRAAQERDFTELIDQSTVIYDETLGRVTVVYLELQERFPDVVDVLRRIKYQRSARTSGMVTTSRVFGYQPRITIRRDYCTATSFANEDPQGHATVAGLAERVAHYYREYNPEMYADHERQVENVLPQWRLEGSVFTSGIVNKNNPLLYHHDAGNFKGVWSNMVGFKQACEGGYLAVPEYGLGFRISDHSLLMFDGQSLLHGVTPFTLRLGGYRYTVVYYSMLGMWQCLTPEQEVARYAAKRTERELRRAKHPTLQ